MAKLSGWLLLAPGLPINAMYKIGLSIQPRLIWARCVLPIPTAIAVRMAAAM
ncbi:hypothetical protein M117_4812 [Bacteroides fragilis str. 3774 T13]|nr:hypothetical protein M117_4812 [Bacteroides fragilis str. 3774 T13]